MRKLPIIFIFDMDKCLVADTEFLLISQTLKTYVVNACKSKKISYDVKIDIGKGNSSVDTSRISPTFFRPGMKENLHAIQDMCDGCAEFFIFSAGTHEYVHTIVPIIEKHTGIKFNRPLLTRENTTSDQTGRTEKSLNIYFDTYMKSLLPKYPSLKTQKHIDIVRNGRIIFFDDNNWSEDSSRDKFIQVVPYNYMEVYDVLDSIPMEVRRDPILRDYLSKYTGLNGFIEPMDVSYTQRNLMYHTFMAELYSMYLLKNDAALKDTFFPELANFMKSRRKLVNIFSKEKVIELRKILQEKKLAL